VQATTNSCGKLPKGLLMGAEIVHDEMNGAFGPKGQHVLLPKLLAGVPRLLSEPFAHCLSRDRTKGAKPLQRAIALIPIRARCGTFPPGPTPTGDGLQRSHFIKANHMTPLRRVAVETDYRVFFTSNSGSFVSHHVCPVRKRRP
jgi:hypothetical protein